MGQTVERLTHPNLTLLALQKSPSGTPKSRHAAPAEAWQGPARPPRKTDRLPKAGREAQLQQVPKLIDVSGDVIA